MALPNPDPVSASFYFAGGSLQRDAPSYVTRQADHDLLEGLLARQFCYVLTSRQMGKSSLMVRTAQRLREQGVAVAVLDLTAIGQNLSPEQWYDGLLVNLGKQLDLEDALDDFWLDHERLAPMRRFFAALHEVVLERIPGPLVVFVDEVDAVRSLPFSADEFFAAIRECYNRRTEDKEMERLTFCLLGVASPSDLIRDTRITPFNIGKRIELSDFTPGEAKPLAGGLNHGEHGGKLLERILYWTGGHPYLTQRLCQAEAEAPNANTSADVDALCKELYLSARARETDDNLLFVRERLLRSGEDIAGLLDLYGKVRSGKKVTYDETNPLVTTLRLSGLVKLTEGRLTVRNRIYSTVFDKTWIQANMPDAELQRQQAAFRTGVLRTVAMASVVLLAMGGLALFGFKQADQAKRNADLAYRREQQGNAARRDAELNADKYRNELVVTESERKRTETEKQRANRKAQEAKENADKAYKAAQRAALAEAYQRKAAQRARNAETVAKAEAAHASNANRTTYTTNVTQVQLEYESDNVKRATELLEATRNNPELHFEWDFWNHLYHTNLTTLQGHTNFVSAVAFSPDGKKIVTGSHDNTARIWNADTGRMLTTLSGHSKPIAFVAFSPDGKRVVTGSFDKTAKVWDTNSGHQLFSLEGHSGTIASVAFSPNDKYILTGCDDKTARLWDGQTGKILHTFTIPSSGEITSLAFSPDGKYLLTGHEDKTVKLWDVAAKKQLRTFKGHKYAIFCVAFSLDGKRVAAGDGGDEPSSDYTVRVWNADTGQELFSLEGHSQSIGSVAFSPDGKYILTGSFDKTAKLWDTQRGNLLHTYRLHTAEVSAVAFSPDGKRILTGSVDKTAKIWNFASTLETLSLTEHKSDISSVAFSPDSKRVVTGSYDKSAIIWDALIGKVLLTIKRPRGSILSVCFSPDGSQILTTGQNNSQTPGNSVELWDAHTGKIIRTFSHPRTLTSVRFSPDGRYILAGSSNKRLSVAILWDAHSGREIRQFRGHTDLIVSVAFSPDGKRIVTGSWDKTAIVWDTAMGKRLLSLKGHSGQVWSVCFSPDGRQILTGGGGGATQILDKTAKLWDAQNGKLIRTFTGHTYGLTSACFSPDSKRILTGSPENVKLWDTNTGQELLTLNHSVISVAFSPDGKRIATGGYDNTAKVWEAELPQTAKP